MHEERRNFPALMQECCISEDPLCWGGMYKCSDMKELCFFPNGVSLCSKFLILVGILWERDGNDEITCHGALLEKVTFVLGT